MATKKIKIQDAPFPPDSFTKEEARAVVRAVKAARTPKNVDPGRPISRPMAPITPDTGWGKTLTKKELLGLVDRIYKKQADREAQKLADKKSK